ncbi:MAG: trigger factor [Calditrichia bacterium]
MQTSVETVNSCTKRVNVELTKEELQPIEQKILKDLQKNAEVKGFRKGKAPMNIIRQRYAETIRQETIETAISDYYSKIIEDSGLQPVSYGRVQDLQFDGVESGLTLQMDFEVEPEFEVQKYKELTIEKDVYEVDDKLIEQTLENIRNDFATLKPAEEAKEGCVVQIDIQELDEQGLPIIGRKYADLSIEIGAGKFDPEIEKQLVGVKAEEKRVIEREYPAPPDAPDQAPQKHRLEITVKKVEEKELPELNDDFVKNLNDETLETMDQLKERIRSNFEQEFKSRSENSFRNRMIDELLKENPFDVPQSMVENYLEEIVKDVERQYQGQKIDKNAVRQNYRSLAVNQMRWFFLRKKLMELEGIEVTHEEAEEFIKNSDWPEEEKKKVLDDHHALHHVMDDLAEQKLFDRLAELNTVVEVFPQKQQAEDEAAEEE